jgi:hypothetical protein
MAVPTAPIAGGSLVAGYLVARESGVRPLGGVVLAAAAAYCGRSWLKTSGPVTTAGLLAVYLGTFGASHPAAKKVGAWPSVLGAAGISGAAAYLLADRGRSA